MQRDSVDKIKYIFRHEREIKDAVLEAKTGAGGHTGGAGGHSYISDPTPAAALRRVEEIGVVTLKDNNRVYKPEKWLKVVSAVRDWCASDMIDREIFCHMLTSPKPRSREAARERMARISEFLHLDRSVCSRRASMICVYGVGVAQTLGAM